MGRLQLFDTSPSLHLFHWPLHFLSFGQGFLRIGYTALAEDPMVTGLGLETGVGGFSCSQIQCKALRTSFRLYGCLVSGLLQLFLFIIEWLIRLWF